MVLAQYLSTTVYRYYINQFINAAAAIFTRRAAIQLKLNFKNPRAGVTMQFLNPRAGTKDDFKNPRAGVTVAFEPITEVAP